MPPKPKPAAGSKKTEQKKKEKVIEVCSHDLILLPILPRRTGLQQFLFLVYPIVLG